MKCLILCLALFACLGSQAQQNEKETIENTAYTFLMAYYTFDIPKARIHSDSETIEYMNMIQEILDSNPVPDSLMNIFLQTEVKVHPLESKIMSDNTIVFYRLSLPESSEVPPLEKSIKMVKQDGVWLAHYTIIEAMEDNRSAADPGEAVEEFAEPSAPVTE